MCAKRKSKGCSRWPSHARYLSRAAFFIAVVFGFVTSGAIEARAELPKVLVLGVGGTIAGEQAEPGTLGAYGITRSVSDIVRQVPAIAQYADVRAEQFANMSTRWLTSDILLSLSRTVNTRFREEPNLSGIVITHGTNKLDETAFFLHLTVKYDRPVVLVAAQRPATGISPDGPLNLLAGVRVAASPAARGKGALVVMDERILSARDVTKRYARSGGFDAPQMGMLGIVGKEVEFFYAPSRRHTADTEFDVFQIRSLPRVDIAHSYVGSDGTGAGRHDVSEAVEPTAPSSSLRPWTSERQEAYEDKDSSVVSSTARGVIVVSTGFTPWESRYYEALRRSGTVVATTFPSGNHVTFTRPATKEDGPPLVGVQHLLPEKARILLMLALTQTSDAGEIGGFFERY